MCSLRNHLSSGMKYQVRTPKMVTEPKMTEACWRFVRNIIGLNKNMTHEIEGLRSDGEKEGRNHDLGDSEYAHRMRCTLIKYLPKL